MRIIPVAVLLACLSAAAIAQTVPAASAATAKTGSITRDQYIEKAVTRARRAAEKRFDKMDADHDGVLTDEEIQAFHKAHPRGHGGRKSKTQ